jgi:hypothetical protein
MICLGHCGNPVAENQNSAFADRRESEKEGCGRLAPLRASACLPRSPNEFVGHREGHVVGHDASDNEDSRGSPPPGMTVAGVRAAQNEVSAVLTGRGSFYSRRADSSSGHGEWTSKAAYRDLKR